MEYALPNRNSLYEQMRASGSMSYSAGVDKTTRNFDGTAARSLVRLTNRIHTEAFPIGVHWCDIRPSLEPGQPSEDEELPKQVLSRMQRDTKVCFDLLKDSNFDLNINEALLETGAVGMGVLKVGASREPGVLLDFEAAPQSEWRWTLAPAATSTGSSATGTSRRSRLGRCGRRHPIASPKIPT